MSRRSFVDMGREIGRIPRPDLFDPLDLKLPAVEPKPGEILLGFVEGGVFRPQIRIVNVGEPKR